MKKSVQLSYVLAIGMVLSSCAKVNYDKKRSAKQISNQTQQNQAGETFQVVEMSEGETKTITLALNKVLSNAMKIKWSIAAGMDNAQVDVTKRFQATEGVLELKPGAANIEINLTAAMPDAEQQGDQLFVINMINEAGQEKKAHLKLIDVKLEETSTPPIVAETEAQVQVAFKDAELSLKADESGEITLVLDQEAKEDVLVEIYSEDNTAIAGQDYINLKQAVSIPAGQKESKIQIVVLSKACDQAKDFKIKMTKATGAKITTDAVKVSLATDSKVKCEAAATETKKKD